MRVMLQGEISRNSRYIGLVWGGFAETALRATLRFLCLNIFFFDNLKTSNNCFVQPIEILLVIQHEPHNVN